MVNVVVAEKPSVARDLAKVLGANQRRDGFLEGNGWKITWALGHLATLKTPDEYDPSLKRWSLESLPFVPARFELKPVDEGGDRKAQMLSREELKSCFDGVPGFPAHSVDDFVFLFSLNGDGQIDFHAFLAVCKELTILRHAS